MQSSSINMQRKPGFPVANCSIRMPDSPSMPETGTYEEDTEQQQRRLQLINFGHAQWGFNNWSWAVTKQELDFIDLVNGKYSAGVVAFVSITVKSFDIHRENIGYATSTANTKGFAIYKSRKCAVTNALRETLLSFGGGVATELAELDTHRSEVPAPAPPPAPLPPSPAPENNQNLANRPSEPKNVHVANKIPRKEDSSAQNMRAPPVAPARNGPAANAARSPPVARAPPLPHDLPPAANRAPAPRAPPPPPSAPRPNSNDGRLEGMTEEEARAERRRRQRVAQEEFRLKQLMKNGTDDAEELLKNQSSLDRLLVEIPTQDIVIEESGDAAPARGDAKRKTPPPEGPSAKMRPSSNRWTTEL